MFQTINTINVYPSLPNNLPRISVLGYGTSTTSSFAWRLEASMRGIVRPWEFSVLQLHGGSHNLYWFQQIVHHLAPKCSLFTSPIESTQIIQEKKQIYVKTIQQLHTPTYTSVFLFLILSSDFEDSFGVLCYASQFRVTANSHNLSSIDIDKHLAKQLEITI